jgi:hypothetical protein
MSKGFKLAKLLALALLSNCADKVAPALTEDPRLDQPTGDLRPSETNPSLVILEQGKKKLKEMQDTILQTEAKLVSPVVNQPEAPVSVDTAQEVLSLVQKVMRSSA